jgi:hypothetical protein
MGILSRFFGRKEDGADRGGELIANPGIKNPLSLQVLFEGIFQLDTERLTAALRSYHPSMARARFEFEPEFGKKGTVIGLAGWGKHVIRLVGFDLPMPADAVERCVAPSHYGDDLKKLARKHNRIPSQLGGTSGGGPHVAGWSKRVRAFSRANERRGLP